MSAELSARLDRVAQEHFISEAKQLEANTPRSKALLLKMAQIKQLDIVILMQGTKPVELSKDERDLSALEKANLVKGNTRYTDHNIYRRYELTEEGVEIAQKLAAEETL